MVAHGDPHIVILDVVSGQILVFAADEGSERLAVAARDFTTYVRALATISALEGVETSSDELAKRILDALGSDVEEKYWKELAWVTVG
jgi:hypothetical protein